MTSPAHEGIHRYLTLAARLFLGAVFIFASIDKIAAPEPFAIAVEAYKILPYPLINLFALVVPWLELLCGIFLIAGYNIRGSAIVASALLTGFTAAILSAMARSLNIDCGCFGEAYQAPVGWARVLEDLGLLLLGAYLYLRAPGAKTQPASEEPPPTI
jgi:uncharacterized membrane protein YphA (DoxX/SURF4 family)